LPPGAPLTIATGRAKRDPTGDLRGALPAVKTEHFAARTDPKRVGALMRAIDGYEGSLTGSLCPVPLRRLLRAILYQCVNSPDRR
jgi:hypothetical protein